MGYTISMFGLKGKIICTYVSSSTLQISRAVLNGIDSKLLYRFDQYSVYNFSDDGSDLHYQFNIVILLNFVLLSAKQSNRIQSS